MIVIDGGFQQARGKNQLSSKVPAEGLRPAGRRRHRGGLVHRARRGFAAPRSDTAGLLTWHLSLRSTLPPIDQQHLVDFAKNWGT